MSTPPSADGGTTASAPSSGCGSAGGGQYGGPGDLFPCDSPWAKDVSALPVSSSSATITSDLQAAGGWGLNDNFQIDFDAVLMHTDTTTPKRDVYIQPRDSSDPNAYYPTESDLISAGRGWALPTPPNGRIQGQSGYVCPQSGGLNQADCHVTVVDDTRHLLFELYGAWIDPNTGRWYASQESVWNLNWHYGASERGRGCTSADAAGLPMSPGVIGLRETLKAVETGGDLGHALRFILPPDRTRRAFVAPASHTQIESALTSSGPPYGIRFRLKASFDESRVTTPGAKAVVRTLKKYGMILADGGQTALSADNESWIQQSDPHLTWSGVLGPFDLFGIKVTDFDVVDYDTSTLAPYTSCSGIDNSPTAAVQPRGYVKRLFHRHRRSR